MKKADIRGIGDRKFMAGIGHFEGSRTNFFDSISHIQINASFDNSTKGRTEKGEILQR
jgi:hypothetical protein